MIAKVISCKASQSAQKAGRVRAAQKVPIHMRRRAASHNIKRLPRHLRSKALSEVSFFTFIAVRFQILNRYMYMLFRLKTLYQSRIKCHHGSIVVDPKLWCQSITEENDAVCGSKPIFGTQSAFICAKNTGIKWRSLQTTKVSEPVIERRPTSVFYGYEGSINF